jgi:3-isopropylmalate/(R)-2-methylmalate dehydratase small subunit
MDNSKRPLNPEFVLNQKRFQGAQILLARQNFGCGSSREHAPRIIKLAGVSAVLAKSFARIFFRNAINVGLPVLELDTSSINQGDKLEVDLEAGTVKNLTTGETLRFQPLPPVMVRILNDGGIVEHFKKYGDFNLG